MTRPMTDSEICDLLDAANAALAEITDRTEALERRVRMAEKSGRASWREPLSGPAHWREADMILAGDPCEYGCPHSGCPHEMRMLAIAQTHALLALTAAVVAGSASTIRPSDLREWAQAIDPEYAAENNGEVIR